MIFFILAGMMKYSGYANAGVSVEALLDSLPPAVKVIMGLGVFDLTKVAGFYGVFFLYFVLLGTVHAVMLGATIISKEERDKTADFLLVKPVKRSKVVTAKLAAAIINVIILNIVTLVTSIINVEMYNDGKPIHDEILKLMAVLFIFQLLFLSIGLVIGVLTRSTKKATGLSTAVLLSTFMLSVIIDLYDKLDFLKYLTPFKYFESKNIMFGGKLDPLYVGLTIIIIAICTGLTYSQYQKRDIHV